MVSDEPATDRAERIYIGDAARIVNRRAGTLRKWEQLGVLPVHLLSQRDDRNRRYWTPEQVEGMKTWIRETKRAPGKGLPYYDPTEAQLDKAIQMMRRPRECALCFKSITKDQGWVRLGTQGVHRACLRAQAAKIS